jgi:hypothetical protein
MDGWICGAMREAIELLVDSGRQDIASDLNRVLSSLDFEQFEIMRNTYADEIADEILEVGALPDLLNVLKKLSCFMATSHCTIHVVSEVTPASFSTRVATTYPEEWISRYLERRYYFIDPVIEACRTQTGGFFWEHLNTSGPILEHFWNDAKHFGVGTSGYSITVDTECGNRLAVSVSSTEERVSFRTTFERHRTDLASLAVLLSESFASLASESRPMSFNLTDDQMMVLRAIAKGARESDLKNMTFLYGSFATIERSICDLFRTRTIAQAAVFAAKIGLFDNAPLTKADVMTSSSKALTARVVAISSATSLRRLFRAHSAFTPFDSVGESTTDVG